MPKCGPPPELYRDMRLIDGKLPRLTEARQKTAANVVTPPKVVTTRSAEKGKQAMKRTTPKADGKKTRLCKKEDKGSKCLLLVVFCSCFNQQELNFHTKSITTRSL